jgi:hypothetical protein
VVAPEVVATPADDTPVGLVDADDDVRTGPVTMQLEGTRIGEIVFTSYDITTSSPYVGEGTYTSGPLVGTWTTEGEQTDYPDGTDGIGAGTSISDVAIDGVGSGTITMVDDWTSDERGRVVSTTTVVSGTGDFEGVTGSGRWVSVDWAFSGSYLLTLTFPG